MSRHIAGISGRRSRERLASIHDEPYVDAVGEPLCVRAPWVVLIPQPSPKSPTAMKAACLIGVSCNDREM